MRLFSWIGEGGEVPLSGFNLYPKHVHEYEAYDPAALGEESLNLYNAKLHAPRNPRRTGVNARSL